MKAASVQAGTKERSGLRRGRIGVSGLKAASVRAGTKERSGLRRGRIGVSGLRAASVRADTKERNVPGGALQRSGLRPGQTRMASWKGRGRRKAARDLRRARLCQVRAKAVSLSGRRVASGRTALKSARRHVKSVVPTALRSRLSGSRWGMFTA